MNREKTVVEVVVVELWLIPAVKPGLVSGVRRAVVNLVVMREWSARRVAKTRTPCEHRLCTHTQSVVFNFVFSYPSGVQSMSTSFAIVTAT